jgi:hypothetical protein
MANSAFSPTLTVTGGTTQQGEINVITNPIAQSDTSGWTTSNVTLSRVATGSPLDPEIPTGFQAVSTTTTTSYAQTTLQLVAPSLRNRKLKLQFFLALTSSTSWKVDVFKSDGVTRYPLSTDSSSVSVIPALTGTYTTTFDMDTDTGIYVRFTRHAGSGSTTLNFTNLIVGPGIQPQGAIIQDWIYYTPTGSLTTNCTYTGRYRRIGSRIRGQVRMEFSGVNTQGNPTFTSAQLLNGLNISFTNWTTVGGVAQEAIGTWAAFAGTSVYSGFVKVNSSASISLIINTSDGYVNTAANVPFTIGSGSLFAFTYELDIAEWSGSGTVQLAQNDVEWASNFSSNDAADTTSFAYGPSGSVGIIGITNLTLGRAKRVRFQTPIQVGDILSIELQDNTSPNSWAPIQNTRYFMSLTEQNTASYGMAIRQVSGSSTDVDVVFGQYVYANGATFGAAGVGWLSAVGTTGYKAWRVRKSSAGAAIGFGLVVPGTSAGLVSASGVPGNTTGNAIASGFVGEWIFATPASAVTFGTTGVVFNITSLALTAGTWLVYGNVTINPATATMTASYGGVSTSSTSFDSLTYVVGGQHTTTTNTYYASLPRVIRTTGTTMYLNGNVSYSGTAGTYSTTSSIQAIRIA